MQWRGAEATVVGGGLVGSLLSVGLAQRGAKVRVLERRADPRTQAKSEGRSINLAISVRGFHALAEAGLEDEVREIALPMRGRYVHAIDGAVSFQPYSADPREQIYSVSRSKLNQILISSAEKAGVEFEFSHRVTGVNLAQRVLEVGVGNDLRKVPYQLLFGTDGSASAIRDGLVREGKSQATFTPLDYGYRELEMAPNAGEFQMLPDGLHIWPRGKFMLIALPNPDRTFTCTLFLANEGAAPSFQSLGAAEAFVDFFRREFPDAATRIPDLSAQVSAHPVGQMGTLRTRGWNFGDEVLLLGDAAHAIVPFFGQGMNAGFEDLTELWEAGSFSAFQEARKPDADAIAELALDNFVEMRDRVGDPEFQRRKRFELQIQKAFGGRYVSRYAMVSFSRLPYREALRASVIQDRVLAGLSQRFPAESELNAAQLEAAVTQFEQEFLRKENQWT